MLQEKKENTVVVNWAWLAAYGPLGLGFDHIGSWTIEPRSCQAHARTIELLGDLVPGLSGNFTSNT